MGTLAGAGLAGRYALLPPSRSRKLGSPRELAIRFYESLDAKDRQRVCAGYDDPIRQYHNRGVSGGGLWANPANLGREQRSIVNDLLHAGLSEPGRQRVPNEFFTKWPGVHAMHVLLCGDPKTPPWQLILTGPHLNLRIGGRSREGAAFGGPLVYGDQRGNSIQGLPDNLYRFQFQTAHRLFQTLRPEQQRLALQETSPIQTDIQLQGSQGSFAGVQIAAISSQSRAIARELIDGILSTYPAEDVAYALQCLEHHGGLERLYLSYYEDSEVDRSGQFQNFRLEGPAAVFYFRGYPHVHAFINVGMDGDEPLSVGEPLGNNPALVQGAGVKRLFEAAMRNHAGSDFAYYDVNSVAGRLRKGPIRSGDIYTLESWQDFVAHLEIKGSNLSTTLVQELRSRGTEPDPRRTYTIATTGYVAGELATEKLGTVVSRQKSGLVRDVAIAYLRKHGFSAAG
ncbi:MAG TPA: DUF3500 domain-containing protein [Myxococcaceae bacterium]|nr:DUF3500 domain-containing protein [Myxococcaceae bacterium]